MLISYLSKRPWNADLKKLCWLLGESFVKVSNSPKDYYGKIYKEKKALETLQNEKGELFKAARKELATKNYGINTEAYKWYIQDKLPPAHIQSRCKRYAVKMFLSHLHHVWYRLHFNKMPPAPYVIGILGHKDMIMPPNLDVAGLE